MRILLIQSRRDKTVADHEVACFAQHTGLRADQMTQWNLVNGAPRWEDVQAHDAILIGGSGEFLLSDGDLAKEVEDLGVMIRKAKEQGMPVLGICFGAQILTQALGGEVKRGVQETGCFEMTKEPLAQQCPLLSERPETFHVQLAHKDHLLLPEGAYNLASTELAEVQLYTFEDAPVYAMLYHSELDHKAMEWRMRHYAKQYGFTEASIREYLSKAPDTSDSHMSLRLFFEHVVIKGRRFKVEP